MADADTLTLSSDSRYKDTNVYTTDTWGPRFALFEAPPEFLESYDDSVIHEVRKYQIGMLDMLAVQYYGAGRESLWWIIALANGIIDQETDMYTGQKLVIPPRSAVLAYISRT